MEMNRNRNASNETEFSHSIRMYRRINVITRESQRTYNVTYVHSNKIRILKLHHLQIRDVSHLHIGMDINRTTLCMFSTFFALYRMVFPSVYAI